MRDVISFRGDKELWDKFANNLKLNKKEIWEILEPRIRQYAYFDIGKVSECVKGALNEYYNSRMVDKMVATQEVIKAEDFIQIRNGGFIEEDVFQKDEGTIAKSPIIHGLGHDIAIGEEHHVVKQIIGSKEIKKQKKIPKSKIDLAFLIDEALEFMGEPVILLPTNLMELVHKDDRYHNRLKFKGSIIILDDYIKLIFVSEDIMSNHIVILEELSCSWLYTKKYDPITEKVEILQINIGEHRKGDKISLIAKTIGKLRINFPDRIKIYKFT